MTKNHNNLERFLFSVQQEIHTPELAIFHIEDTASYIHACSLISASFFTRL